MATTQNTYTGDGSTVLFSFTFPYLETTDIKVSLNGTVTTAYTLANATTVQFNTAPANGAAIRIYRQTDDASLAATFYPGSAIRSQDLNENFTQNLYVTQESNRDATQAIGTADSAVVTANSAVVTANAATVTANTASTNASAAVATANTASSNASTAVSTANTANSNATTAVSTANAASATATSAASDASTALSTANSALSTANTALSNATAAVNTANSASSAASSAVSTANTASTTASNAVSTANTANSNASTALSTANTAISTANAASAAVVAAVAYQPVVNLTTLGGLTPADGDFFELQDSTGADTDPSITGVPAGTVGSSGLTFRLRYDDPPGEYTYLGYFANDSETRYLKLDGGTLIGQLAADNSTSAATPGYAFDGDVNTGMGRPGPDELALITGGTARLTIDSAGSVAVPGSLSQGGNAVVVTTDSRLSDTRTPTDNSVTDAKVAVGAAINKTKISGTAITAADIGTVTGTMIADGTISNADISPSAGIEGSKITPTFGSQVVTCGSIGVSGASIPPAGMYVSGPGRLAFSSGGNLRMEFDSFGRLIVGPPIFVAGQCALHTTDGLSLINNFNNRIEYHGSSFTFNNKNPIGAIGINFNIGPGGGAPTASLSGAGTWVNASDIKNKKNITDISYGIETIKQIAPRQFDLIASDRHSIGFVAQEIEPFIPEVVFETSDQETQESHLGLDYGALTAVLTKALQEVLQKVETLEAKVADLEGV